MTTVGILGTMYGEPFISKYNCSLSLYKELILEFSPDVICGEVHPNSWDIYLKERKIKEYPGMPDYEYWDLIFPLCEEKGIIFIPVDWGETDVWWDFEYFREFPSEQRNELEKQLYLRFEKQVATFDQSPIPFNSFAYDKLAKDKYDWLYSITPEPTNFRWICRNQIMVQRIKNAIRKHEGKRILCIAGADHNYCYYDALKNDESLELVYPLK